MSLAKNDHKVFHVYFAGDAGPMGNMSNELPIFNIPSFFVYIPFIPINFLLNIFGIKHPFDPVRIKKVSLSNNIEPKFLIDNNYKFKFALEEALLDWKNKYPEEWQLILKLCNYSAN